MITESDAIPRGDDASHQWIALGYPGIREVIKSARQGRRIEDQCVAAVAVGWAWTMLGEPGSRTRLRWWQALYGVADGVGHGVGDVFDGGEDRRFNLYVRWIARRVERFNWGGAE
jgi:hypothetical protein